MALATTASSAPISSPSSQGNGQAGGSNGITPSKCTEALDKAYDQLEILLGHYNMRKNQIRTYEPKTQAGRTWKEGQHPHVSARIEVIQKLMESIGAEIEIETLEVARSLPIL